MKKWLHKTIVMQMLSLLPVVTAFVVVVWPLAVHAQESAPEPQLRSSPHPIIGFGVMFVMVVVVIAISLLPSKRGHQD